MMETNLLIQPVVNRKAISLFVGKGFSALEMFLAKPFIFISVFKPFLTRSLIEQTKLVWILRSDETF